MLAFMIWTATSLIFVGIGVCARIADKPVLFWTMQKEIKVSDVRAYNRAVAYLWFVFAGALALLGLPLLAGQNSPYIIISIIGTVVACILLMVAYTRIEKKYRAK